MQQDAMHDSIDKEDMKKRTKSFGLRVIKLVDALPVKRSAEVLGKQLLRSATSVGANYRAALRGRSRAEFIAKLGIVEEEADESQHWIDMLIDAGHVPKLRAGDLMKEADELTAIIVATIRTAKRNSATKPKSGKSEIRNPKSEM